MEDLNIALLIDADNLSSKYIGDILDELTKYGKVTIRRMYGDWSQSCLKPWLDKASEFSLNPVMQENNTKGKNATDICLVIDAMDILFENKAQCFCVASSDSDFNKLAKRLRESGNLVIGMGEQKTPESFRASCERFVFLDVLNSNEEEEDDTSYDFNTKAIKESEKTANNEKRSCEKEYEYAFTPKKKIENAIVKIITDNNVEGKDTNLGEIGSRLRNMFSDFDIRNYGYSKFSTYINDFDSLILSKQNSTISVNLKYSSESEIEKLIKIIFKKSNINTMNIGELKRKLCKKIPNVNATVRKSGFTKFSDFLRRKVKCVTVDERHNYVRLKEKYKI